MNTYKDFVVLNNIALDPRDVHLFVDWLLSCAPDTQAYKIGEAMQAAVDNYIDTYKIDVNNKYGIANYCDNLNFEGECRITNAICDNCISLGRLLEDDEQEGAEND